MKTMLCMVELFDGMVYADEEFDVEVVGKYPEEDYEAVNSIIKDVLETMGYTRCELDNCDINFTLESI